MKDKKKKLKIVKLSSCLSKLALSKAPQSNPPMDWKDIRESLNELITTQTIVTLDDISFAVHVSWEEAKKLLHRYIKEADSDNKVPFTIEFSSLSIIN